MLLLFAPLMLLISALIVRRDGWGVFYVHKRIGRNGQTFGCIKFRTMVKDADQRLAQILATDPVARKEWAACQKLRNDPRIISGIGHRLRQSSLDELPQIWNVIRGDMSIVGSRPVTRDELVRYGLAGQLYMQMRPGLTGPWQVGGRSEASYEARIRMDVEYFRSWSFVQDIQITAKTALMVLKGRSPGAF
ncbi:sugar transferase (plasmid) [Leisingera sp. NJS201]|uniref:sugar transferase n=1 Tax=Leisingera sp. NJS201 TaxID=2508306 RepID=UPI001071210A|nr:sugar transferase [Leisingera sp. NJS201]QBR38576.1 sugar transferase [Leisingera sp. NJS201]